MANKNATYVIEFTLRDSAQQRHITTDESENVIVSVSTDGADFTASGATVSAVKKNNALTGIYKVSLQLTGNAVGVLIEHPTLYPYPDFIWIATEQGRLDAAVTSRAAPGDAMSLTSTERSNIASAVWNFMAELSVTAVGLLRLIAAVVQGKRTVDGNTETYYGLDGTTARVVGSVDEQGNRNITTRNP